MWLGFWAEWLFGGLVGEKFGMSPHFEMAMVLGMVR